MATAATGALTVGGAAASPGALVPGDRGSLTEQAITGSSPLAGAALADALALRAQDATERSSARERLADSVAASQAQAAADAQQALDEIDTERAARIPVEVEPTWVMPVEGYVFTSPFGQRWGKLHAGLDLAAPTGTPLYSIGDGEVVEAVSSGGYGMRTIIRYADGSEVWYCHQSRFEVTSGRVTAGQLIGYVGSTGNSTGPHLHLEVHPGGGDPIDPQPWLASLGLTL